MRHLVTALCTKFFYTCWESESEIGATLVMQQTEMQ
jgi:hypothetical protein